MKKLLAKLMAFAAAIIMFASCSKSSDSPSNPSSGSYPKTVTVEYRVTATSGNPVGDISIQQQGNNESIMGTSLPFSKKYTLTVSKNQSLYCGFTSGNAGAIRVDILVDGSVIATQTASGTSVIIGSAFYMFP